MTITTEYPNGPALITVDQKKDKFKLDFGGQTILSVSAKLNREGVSLSFKDFGARLIVMSKHDGWDVVKQYIRVAIIGAQPGDIIELKGTLNSGDAGIILTQSGSRTDESDDVISVSSIYCCDLGWKLSLENDLTFDLKPLDGVDYTMPLINKKIIITTAASEFMLIFEPRFNVAGKELL